MTTILLGSVDVAESNVDTSGLTGSEQTELDQLYQFSAQLHPPTTGSGDTVEQVRQIDTFDDAIELIKDDMARGVRYAMGVAALFSAGGYLCGRRLRRAQGGCAR